MDREQSRATFERLARKFPGPDTAGGYDAFIAAAAAKRGNVP
jgi:hypothetical protein